MNMALPPVQVSRSHLARREANIASPDVLRHLNADQLAQATEEIKAHGHPANIQMLAEFAEWAKTNPFIRR